MPTRDLRLLSCDRVLRQRTATDSLQHSQICCWEARAGQDAAPSGKEELAYLHYCGMIHLCGSLNE